MPDARAREALVAALLDAWPWHLGGVVIGGYAVAAYGAPRYSHDIDIVVPVAALGPLEAWLTAQGFAPDRVREDLAQNHAGKLARWRQGDITLDLVPGVVRDREAHVDIPETWVARSPLRTRLLLIDTSTRSEIPVARLEAFWALKLQAGRDQDIADLFAIHDQAVELDEVRALFEGLWCETLEAKLQGVHARLDEDKLYRDCLSRWSRGKPTDAANRKAWKRFTEMVTRAIPGDKRIRRDG